MKPMFRLDEGGDQSRALCDGPELGSWDGQTVKFADGGTGRVHRIYTEADLAAAFKAWYNVAHGFDFDDTVLGVTATYGFQRYKERHGW